MTAAPQGTLIQIFVELSKWGVGEPPSWSVSRQVSCRWLVTAGPRAGLKESPQRGFWAPDGALGDVSQEEDDGGRRGRGPGAARGALVLGLVVVGRFVEGWEPTAPGSASPQRCPTGSGTGTGTGTWLGTALVRFPPARGEQGTCGFA